MLYEVITENAAFAPLRAALARDIEKLKALPAFDPGALGQQLERLAVSVESLPLAFDERAPAAASGDAAAATPSDEVWYRRLGAEVWHELRKLVIVRITSYNVCYTKLLRTSSASNDHANRPAAISLRIRASPRSMAVRSLRLRITSYNVCYTKLLRFQAEQLAQLAEDSEPARASA